MTRSAVVTGGKKKTKQTKNKITAHNHQLLVMKPEPFRSSDALLLAVRVFFTNTASIIAPLFNSID